MSTSLDLENVCLQFNLRQFKGVALKTYFLEGLFRRSKNPRVSVEALKNINLHIKEGERVGIIGHNGAGKSTLLKVLAGVYQPTSGTCAIQGEVSSLFDLQLGFEPHASGWDNIAYRGYLQGETPRTLRTKIQAIAEFSELGDRLDTEIRHYSSGMIVRLAFSIATAIDPEILLVDEVLSAGDLSFQQKARQRMNDMINKARLIVMVSHDLQALQKFCTRVIWLEHGQIHREGPAKEIIDAYTDKMQPPEAKDSKAKSPAPALKIAS